MHIPSKISNPQVSKSRSLRISLTALACCLASCSTVRYYSQAFQGQMEILHKAKPIPKVLADPTISPKLRERLKLVLELRQFANTTLHLPVKRQYSEYTDLKRQHVVWVVFAAPEFSVEGRKWWYPFIGSLKYRGYFSKEMAREEADKLRARGDDVFWDGVDAYSTLGLLRDPVLNTFIRYKETWLAETLFHELTHQRLFVPGQTDFNEAFATSNARQGVRLWLKSKGRLAELAQFEREKKWERQFIALLLETRTNLKALYSTHRGEMPENLRKLKHQEFLAFRARYEKLKQRWGGTKLFDKWFEKPDNNARLNTVATYFELEPKFEALFEQCGRDFEKFYKAVQEHRPPACECPTGILPVGNSPDLDAKREG